MNKLEIKDYLVFLVYILVVSLYGLWIYNRKRLRLGTGDSKDYFLAEGTLTWWAIGSSLIASNISAEQFIGMSGFSFKVGLAVASYEWMAAAALLVVAIFFIPVYLRNKIYTMPQFLRQRYNETVAMIMAVFWLLLYIVVNLTSILYLGAIAVSSISGFSLASCMYGIALFAVLITLGGMKVIGYTDVVQVFFLILGGLATTFIALNLVGKHYGAPGVLNGFHWMIKQASDHFRMILTPKDSGYADLPGLSVIIGGLWVANLSYWGCNQYITQRALGANLRTARGGLLFAAFLKLLTPLIVVFPGIAAYVLYKDGIFRIEMTQAGELNPDHAYPVLMGLLPSGLKGLAFAALTAAVVASLAGKINSIATIFSLDIYKKAIHTQANEKELITTGKIAAILSMAMGVLIAPYLGIDKKGGFQYIQEYTGFVSPGVFAMFSIGFFWKKATSNAALFATVGGFILSVAFKLLPKLVNLSFLEPYGFSFRTAGGVYEIPFLDRMGFVFLICAAIMYFISLIENKQKAMAFDLKLDHNMFKPHPGFIAGAALLCGLLVALYVRFW